ncbi:MAG: adenylate/guanylate cyclase domain-containing protein [Rhodospirillales bacterium]|jgi:class 3 adenylate cyclase
MAANFPIPENETERLADLNTYNIMDTAPEISFDEITALAAEILQCPVSFIEFMDDDRQWFKSKYGLPDEMTEMPRDVAICSTTICQSDLLLVSDLSKDDRFSQNPMVSSAPNIRFYAGMPLITPAGQAIGTMCTVDFETKEITIGQQEALRSLSHQVMTQLELRRALIEMAEAEKIRNEIDEQLKLEKLNLVNLMSNVLPKRIAEDLLTNGKVEPQFFDEASIMFCDFVGFTRLSEALSPKNLVELLHQCFCKFDAIVKKHNIEKIKTIGDAYMCVSGVTEHKKGHAERICMAALDMQNYLDNANKQREKLRMPKWEMRIGIHTGPLIAGVVGENKFTFDVWGDAVNVAALMEQKSEAGKINISDTTQHRVKEFFDIEDRGLIASSKKGEKAMYFLNRLSEPYAEDQFGLTPNNNFKSINNLEEQ